MNNIIHLKEVWKIYKMDEVEVPALQGLNLEVKKGEFLAILGKSGSGKSTALNMIGALDIPTRGHIFLNNQDISILHESDLAQLRGKIIGYVFQTFNLIPSLSALENVMLPMTFQGMDRDNRIKRAKELLERVQLSHRINHKPGELSIGKDEYIIIRKDSIIKPIKISKFIDDIIKTSKNIKKIPNINEGIRAKINLPIEIVTFDNNYNQIFSKLKQVIRHKTRSIYEIKTEYGYKINCTGAHSIFIYSNGNILPKLVSELELEDTIPIAMELPNNSYLNNKTINFKKELNGLSQYKQLIFEKNKIRFKASRFENSIPQNIKINKKLCRILGDFASEGCVRYDEKNNEYYLTFTLGITEEKRANTIKRYFEDIFKIKLNKKTINQKNVILLKTGNKLLSLIFLRVFNTGEKSYSRDFSDIIFNVSNDLKLEFLSGVFGDGTHRKKGNIKGKEKRREISIKTTSEILAKKLNFLFLQLKYVPAIEEFTQKRRSTKKIYKLILYGKQCLKFAKELNKRGYKVDFLDIGQMGKIDILPNYIPLKEDLMGLIDSNRKLFTTKEHPGIGGILRKDMLRKNSIRKELLNHLLFKFDNKKYKKIINGEVGFLKIKEIKEIKKSQYVYDVSDDNNRFIGTHGIYLHNSGGERQRVAIARALSNNPDVILADEPTGNLDSKTGDDIIEMFSKFHKEDKKTIIMVTHDEALVKHAERVCHLKDGKIIKEREIKHSR